MLNGRLLSERIQFLYVIKDYDLDMAIFVLQSGKCLIYALCFIFRLHIPKSSGYQKINSSPLVQLESDRYFLAIAT